MEGILCPECGKFTPIEELKEQTLPEWIVYGAGYGSFDPFNATSIRINRIVCDLLEHKCGFRKEEDSPFSYEIELLEDGRIKPVGSYWKGKLLVGDEFELVRIEKDDYSYFAFVPAGKEKLTEEDLVPLRFTSTNLPYQTIKVSQERQQSQHSDAEAYIGNALMTEIAKKLVEKLERKILKKTGKGLSEETRTELIRQLTAELKEKFARKLRRKDD